MKITKAQILENQKKWAQAVENSSLDSILSLYAADALLKPTVSNIIRRDHDSIQSYFIGGEKFNDIGFFNKGITKVHFQESEPLLFDSLAVDCGEYEFLLEDGNKIEAHYTFTYRLNPNNNEEVLIQSQHSSLKV